jgi:hypothetical protein
VKTRVRFGLINLLLSKRERALVKDALYGRTGPMFASLSESAHEAAKEMTAIAQRIKGTSDIYEQ